MSHQQQQQQPPPQQQSLLVRAGAEVQQQQHPQRPSIILTAVQTLALILVFYAFSISLTFYNKKYITVYPYPLSITVLHLVVKFLLAWIIRSLLLRRRCRGSGGGGSLELSWRPYCRRVAPAGIASSIDIGLSNWSFEFITVSLYTMTKSSAVVFILLFAIYFKLEEKRWSQVLIILLIFTGLFLFTYKSTQFHTGGFLLVLGASFVSGIRWTTAQVVTQRAELGLANPVDMCYHVQPWMVLALLPLAVAFEGTEIATTANLFRAGTAAAAFVTLRILLLGALLAFGLECAEYLLLSRTSSLTLSVAGIFKEICTIVLAALINRDPINMVNWIGMAVCLSGISLHCCLKAASVASDHAKEAEDNCWQQQQQQQQQLCSANPTAALPAGREQQYKSETLTRRSVSED